MGTMPKRDTSCAASRVTSAIWAMLGVGDGERTAFRLRKLYGDGEDAAERLVAKSVEGSVRVAVGSEELTGGAFDVDATTGVVALQSAPPEGAAVTAGFEFDVPVRFDADRLEVTLESFAAGRMAAVPCASRRPSVASLP